MLYIQKHLQLKNYMIYNYVVVLSTDIPLWRLTTQFNVRLYQLLALRMSIMM